MITQEIPLKLVNFASTVIVLALQLELPVTAIEDLLVVFVKTVKRLRIGIFYYSLDIKFLLQKLKMKQSSRLVVRFIQRTQRNNLIRLSDVLKEKFVFQTIWIAPFIKLVRNRLVGVFRPAAAAAISWSKLKF